MKVRITKFKGARAEYKEVRGPDGSRFALWRRGRRARQMERFGLDVVGHGAAEVRRVMRNARRQEARS